MWWILLGWLRDWSHRQRIPCECGTCAQTYWPWQIKRLPTGHPEHPYDYIARSCLKQIEAEHADLYRCR